jgi:hypothetical protein
MRRIYRFTMSNAKKVPRKSLCVKISMRALGGRGTVHDLRVGESPSVRSEENVGMGCSRYFVMPMAHRGYKLTDEDQMRV